MLRPFIIRVVSHSYRMWQTLNNRRNKVTAKTEATRHDVGEFRFHYDF